MTDKNGLHIEISDEILQNLQKNKIPEKIITKLRILKGKIFESKEDFEEAFELIINKEDFDYKDTVFEYIDIIEDDTDTFIQEKYESKGIYPYDPLKADINIQPDPQTVHELVIRKWKEREIIIVDPAFQRKFIWTPHQQSKFIESVILGFPLPPFYLNKNTKGDLFVVDGRQRLTSLRNFLENKLSLSGLDALPNLNGKYFNDLKELDKTQGTEYQTKIEDRTLFVYFIPPSVPMEIVYDIFNRINTGGTQLQRQEIRNAIYIGAATKFLKKLASKSIFIQAIDSGVSPKRLKDQEVVLRYLAFQVNDYENDYHGSMSDFLDKTMQFMNKVLPETELEKLEKNFEKVMKYTFDFFGRRNFRIPTRQTRGRINIAHLEAVSAFFAKQTVDFLERNKDQIIKNYQKLLQDNSYISAVTNSTGSVQNVKTRFSEAAEILEKDIK